MQATVTPARPSRSAGGSNPARRPAPEGASQAEAMLSCTDRKQQQLVFQLVRQLAEAQFRRADPVLSARLWQEVLALEIDPERITRLLYGGQDPEDRQALAALDPAAPPLPTSPPSRSRWAWLGRAAVRPLVGVGLRNAPPAAFRAHRTAG
ncbi:MULTISPECIES: hypothetical protein [unclassified Synechococcus]|uniref:hypothetical protein n=1 Tax=unclassified Synechococcus TaxID=2626047 RepID=UPI0021A39128|nr:MULTISPECIES: hypothetical protein [unclassified Synechococcus]MCT0214543.1 hypothetical protein [Synechococcus sp. CS-1326]MCT0234403.1 hypothetical protein [Synechococcus sp. CS-1327]